MDYSPNSQLLRAEASGSTIPDKVHASTAQGQTSRPTTPQYTSRSTTSETNRASISEKSSVKEPSDSAEDQKVKSEAKHQRQLKILFTVDGQNSKDEACFIPRQPLMDSHEKDFLISLARVTKSLGHDPQYKREIVHTQDGVAVNVFSEIDTMANGWLFVKDREGLLKHLKDKVEKEKLIRIRSEDEVANLRRRLHDKPSYIMGLIITTVGTVATLMAALYAMGGLTVLEKVAQNTDPTDKSKPLAQQLTTGDAKQNTSNDAKTNTLGRFGSWFWST